MPHLEHAHLHRRQDGMFSPGGLVGNLPRPPPLGQILNPPSDGGDAVSVVYVTASATFSGPFAFSTVGAGPTSTQGSAPSTTVADSSVASTSSPASTSAAASSSRAASSPTTNNNNLSLSPASASAVPTSSSSAAADSADQGLSGGAKAGIAFGVILAIAALAGLGLFFWKRKQKAQEQHQLNEKTNPFADNVTAAPPMNMQTVSPPMQAPQAFPMRPAGGDLFPGSQSAAFGAGAGLGAGAMATGAMGANSHHDAQRSEDPFGPHAEIPPSAPGTSAGPPAGPTAPYTPTAIAPDPYPQLSSPSDDLPEALQVNSMHHEEEAIAGAVAVGAAAGIAAAAAGRRSPGPGPVPSSPTGSTTSAATAGGSVKGNVHRVQLDFAPSMEDELELRHGDLVRVLHEYDDGWALCTRMDRSRQGVAPRSCLSSAPVKPRGPGGPGRPGPGPGPRIPMQRPDSPAGRGPNDRNLIPNNGMPRPGGPGAYPGSMGTPRSGSPALGGPGMRNGPPRGGSPGPGMRNGPPRAGSPGPGMRNGPPRAGSPGPGMRNGPPRAGSPGPMGPGMRNGPPRAGSPGPMGPGMRNGPPRSGSPGPMGPGGPMMPGAQRQRSNSAAMAPEQRSPPGPSQMGPESPVLSNAKISRKPVGADA